MARVGAAKIKIERDDGAAVLAVTMAFVDRINHQDVDALCALVTKDHRFVDSLGEVHRGRETMRDGWCQYFAMFPDCRITIATSLADRARAALFGTTSGTYAPRGKRVVMHAAWLAVARGSNILEWRVCADNEPVRAAMRP